MMNIKGDCSRIHRPKGKFISQILNILFDVEISIEIFSVITSAASSQLTNVITKP